MQMTRSKWFQPAFALALGVLLFSAMWIGGDPRTAVFSFLVMAALAAVILLGGRSETIRGLRGDGSDERFRQIDVTATAIAGMVVIAAIIGAFVVEVARGQDGSPYSQLGAVGGVAYVVAIVVLRLRG